ncbi:MAG: hypothetical protein ACQEQC_07355 [Elusimicrobiota bacterium]
MISKIFRYLVMGSFAVVIFIKPAPAAEQPYFGGYLRNYTGVLTETSDYSIIQNTFELDIQQSRGDVSLRVQPYVYQYPADGGGEPDFGLRQAYMDLYAGPVDLRIGKQQIIWGKANGVFVTDIVSPKDYSEFILPDFEEVRIGVTSVKADYYRGNKVLEMVWIPDFTSNRAPAEDSIWYRKTQTFPVEPDYDYSKKDIENNLENSEVFARFASLGQILDMELIGGYMWEDSPTLHVEKTKNPSTGKISDITVTPEHHRLDVYGGSLSSDISGYVLTAEGAYYSGDYFSTEDPQDTDSVTEKDYLHYMAGVSKKLGDYDVNFQYIQEYIVDYNDHIKDDEFTDTATFMVNRDFLNNKLLAEFFVYYGVNTEDFLLRPKLNYEFEDGYEIIAGADIFGGNEGKFGEYDENDMVYTKFKYSF